MHTTNPSTVSHLQQGGGGVVCCGQLKAVLQICGSSIQKHVVLLGVVIRGQHHKAVVTGSLLHSHDGACRGHAAVWQKPVEDLHLKNDAALTPCPFHSDRGV